MIGVTRDEARMLAKLARKAGHTVLARRLERAASSKSNPESLHASDAPAAQRLYQRVHWGERGKRAVANVFAPNPLASVPVDLGILRRVDYETVKGGDGGKRTLYAHAFGKGDLERCEACGEFTVVGSSKGCPTLGFVKGGLLILGGGYRVTERGIVG